MKRIFFVVLLCGWLFAAIGPRVFVMDKDDYQAFAAGGVFTAGIHVVNTEQIKTLNKSCPVVTITTHPDSADYIIVWDTKDWNHTSWSGHQNEFAIYNAKGDVVASGAAHKISNAAKDICKALVNNWKAVGKQ